MSKGIVISCFDYSTNMVKPWAEAGYRCICIDSQHSFAASPSGNIHKVYGKIEHSQSWGFSFDEVVMVFFFPPCTDVAVSGARYFKEKGLWAVIEALKLFAYSKDLAERLNCPWMIENPVSTISTYWRKPDYTFDPCDYGDPWTKKTCLWTGGGFVMPPKNRVEPVEGSKMHKMGPSPERARLRSETPPGFARAVYEVNRIE